MEDALADEMNIHKKINQTKENINQIRFKLHETEENLQSYNNSDEKGRTSESLKLAYDNAKQNMKKPIIHIPKATAYVTSFLKYSIN
ncbi:MAG: hypothetical protein ACLT33_13710 [Lachnospira pectinoschiza]